MATTLAGRFASLTWKGHRVLAIDGTRKNMPRSGELADFFGIPSGAFRPQMLVCTLYDVLAKIPLDGVAAHHATSERALAGTLIENLKPGDLLLMDRGFRLFDELLKTEIDFLVRLPLQGLFGSVRSFLDKGRADGAVKINPSQSVIREYRREGLADPMQLARKRHIGRRSCERSGPLSATRPFSANAPFFGEKPAGYWSGS